MLDLTRSVSAAALLAALALPAACEPTRVMPVVKCSESSDCPADGRHFCNLQAGVCETCDGPCPGSLVPDTATGADAADAAAEVTATDAAAEVTGADALAEVSGVDDATAASCVGHCDGQAPAGCYCDDLCETTGDCCPDYQQVCGGGDADAGGSGDDAVSPPADATGT